MHVHLKAMQIIGSSVLENSDEISRVRLACFHGEDGARRELVGGGVD
jgi:hypothetical protein